MEKKTRTHLGRALAFCGLFVLTFMAYLVLAINLASVPGMVNWEHDVFLVKDRIALEKQSPKIILLAGSNGMFGVSAKEIEKTLGIPAVNYANDVWLTTYMFEKAKRVAKKGDIILMPLEYEYYYYDNKLMFGTQTIKERYILTFDPEYFNKLPALERVNMVSVGAIDLINNFRSRINKVKPFYNVSTLNAWGDETNNSFSNRDYSKFRGVRIRFPSDFERTFPNYGGPAEILAFCRWANESGISVIATFPSVVKYPEYETPAAKRKFALIEEFYHQNGIRLLGDPYEYMYDSELFYDSNYHLNDLGMEIRTESVIEGLRGILNK